MQNEQVSGTVVSRKCTCSSLASSGTMKPCTRCTVPCRACCSALNWGTTRVLVVFFSNCVSVDQGSTSSRWGSGLMGLCGLW